MLTKNVNYVCIYVSRACIYKRSLQCPLGDMSPVGTEVCIMTHELFVSFSLLEESTLQRVIGELADRVGELKGEQWKTDDERVYNELGADTKAAEKVLAIARRARRAMQ